MANRSAWSKMITKMEAAEHDLRNGGNPSLPEPPEPVVEGDAEPVVEVDAEHVVEVVAEHVVEVVAEPVEDTPPSPIPLAQYGTFLSSPSLWQQ